MTVHVTTVVPFGKTEGALLVTVATPQLSEVVGVPRLGVAVQLPGSVDTLGRSTHVIFGFSLSFTVTFCLHVAVFPEVSVTVQVTTVSPLGNVAGASLVTVATPQLSEVVGVPRFTPEAVHPSGSVDTLGRSAGHVIFGFSWS